MVESIIMLLIYICIVAIMAYLILWVLEQCGLALPPQVVKLIWVIAVLVILLIFARMFLPMVQGGRLLSWH